MRKETGEMKYAPNQVVRVRGVAYDRQARAVMSRQAFIRKIS